MRRGKYEQARERFVQSQAITADLGIPLGVSWTAIQLGHVEMHLGRYDRAREEGDRALNLCREQNIQQHLGHALLLLSSIAMAEAMDSKAQALLEESVDVLRHTKRSPGLEQALAVQALCAFKLSQTDLAWQCLREVVFDADLRGFEEGLYAPRLTAALACALLLAERGESERASQVYALVQRDPHVSHSRWFADVCERKISATPAPPREQAEDLIAVMEDVLDELG
jgi:tetratricopeptide (TPR) repeat protein